MLKPEDLKNLPENFMKQMQDLEDYLITEISRRIAKQGELSETAIHQIERAALNGADIKEIEKYVSKVTNAAMKDIDREIRECVDNSIDLDNAIFKRAGYDPVDLAKSASLTKIIEAGLKQTKGELLNITGSMGFEKVLGEGVEGYKEFYQHAMDFSALLVQTGSVDYITATRMVTKKMTDKGLSWVDYASGHTNRVDVAARRAIITGVNQMNSQMTNSLIEQFGAEYVETTAHMGARPDHQIWQGQVFHIGGAKDGYPDFYEATGYGTVTGLCGANCRHSYFMFFPGISERTYTDAQLKNIDPAPITYKGKQYTYYEATQKQRQMETAIRKTKREIVSADASMDKDMFLAKSIRLQTQKAEYKSFSNIANLRVKMERTQEVGYGRSIAQKSVVATKKAPKVIQKDFDITDEGKYTNLRYSGDLEHKIDQYQNYIGHEYATQNFSVRESNTLWDKRIGYIQNTKGYKYINNYMRELIPALDRPGRGVTIRVAKRATRNNALVKDYIGTRKVDEDYLKNVLHLDTRSLFKSKKCKDAGGVPRDVTVPKDADSASIVADMINKLVGTKEGTVTDKAFTSISLSRDLNYFTHYPIRFDIQMPKGTKGLITSNMQESEFLAQNGSSLEILGATVYNDGEKDCIKIFARIVQ